MKTNTARKAMCVFSKLRIPVLFLVLRSLFSRAPWASMVLLLFAVKGVRKDLSYFCFPTRRNERKKWGVFSKRADKKFKTLGDPRICSSHFKESDIEISLFGRKSVRSDCYPTIFNQTKSTNTVISRSKRLADRKRL